MTRITIMVEASGALPADLEATIRRWLGSLDEYGLTVMSMEMQEAVVPSAATAEGVAAAAMAEGERIWPRDVDAVTDALGGLAKAGWVVVPPRTYADFNRLVARLDDALPTVVSSRARVRDALVKALWP